MKKLQILSVSLLLGFLFIISSKAYATTIEPMTFEEMIEQADFVIIGKIDGTGNERVEKISDPEIGEYKRGYTDWEIEVSSYLKGDAQGKKMVISTPGPGAEADDETFEFVMRTDEYRLDELIANIEVGLTNQIEEILFFLEERDGHYYPLRGDAIVPLDIIYWEDHINREVVNVDEMEQDDIEELSFLQKYLKSTPHYSPDGEVQNRKSSHLYLYLVGIIPISLLVWYYRRRKGAQ